MMKQLIYLTLILPVIAFGRSRDQKEINKSYPVTGDAGSFHLLIENIQGDVLVEGYDGSTIELELTITVDAHDQEELDQAMEELELEEIQNDNSLLLRMKSPFVVYEVRNGFRGGRMQCNGPDYRYSYDFKLRVPSNILLHASTINDGRIRITDVASVEYSSNINGPIRIENVRDTEEISTINGDIDITYAQRPRRDGQFHTINGDITLELPDDFVARVEAQSMQGDLFSAFDYKALPRKVEVNEGRRGRETKYEIENKTAVKIGEGDGPLLRFETLNGDMFLRRI